MIYRTVRVALAEPDQLTKGHAAHDNSQAFPVARERLKGNHITGRYAIHTVSLNLTEMFYLRRPTNTNSLSIFFKTEVYTYL